MVLSLKLSKIGCRNSMAFELELLIQFLAYVVLAILCLLIESGGIGLTSPSANYLHLVNPNGLNGPF